MEECGLAVFISRVFWRKAVEFRGKGKRKKAVEEPRPHPKQPELTTDRTETGFTTDYAFFYVFFILQQSRTHDSIFCSFPCSFSPLCSVALISPWMFQMFHQLRCTPPNDITLGDTQHRPLPTSTWWTDFSFQPLDVKSDPDCPTITKKFKFTSFFYSNIYTTVLPSRCCHCNCKRHSMPCHDTQFPAIRISSFCSGCCFRESCSSGWAGETA